MAGVSLFAVFFLSCGLPIRAQDVRSHFQVGSVARDYLDNRHCSYTFVVPPGSRAEGCSPSGQASTEAVTQEEMDGLKNQVDRLSTMVDSLSGKNMEMTVNLTRALLQLAEGCSPSGETTTETVTQEEMDGMKGQVDHLSSMVESLSGQLSDEKVKNTELTVNLTRALLRLNNLTTNVYENGIAMEQANIRSEALDRPLIETKEETDSLKNQVDSLSRQLSDEKGKILELTVNLTRALLQLDNLTITVHENGNAIQLCSCDMPEVTSQTDPTSTADPATTTTWPSNKIEADCADYYASGNTTSGVYTIGSLRSGTQAYCDMDTAGGGWTVIQRRQDGSVPFNRTWEEYKRGFGNKNGEYWLGNDNIHLLTNQKSYSLRVDLEDWNGNTVYAHYTTFSVSGEADQYRLQLSGYTGDAGDSMTGPHTPNNGQMFSTVDRDNDGCGGSCHCSPQQYGQGGWWYRSCSRSNLNGRYLGNCGSSCSTWGGVTWYDWKDSVYSMKSVSMKIRP